MRRLLTVTEGSVQVSETLEGNGEVELEFGVAGLAADEGPEDGERVFEVAHRLLAVAEGSVQVAELIVGDGEVAQEGGAARFLIDECFEDG